MIWSPMTTHGVWGKQPVPIRVVCSMRIIHLCAKKKKMFTLDTCRVMQLLGDLSPHYYPRTFPHPYCYSQINTESSVKAHPPSLLDKYRIISANHYIPKYCSHLPRCTSIQNRTYNETLFLVQNGENTLQKTGHFAKKHGAATPAPSSNQSRPCSHTSQTKNERCFRRLKTRI